MQTCQRSNLAPLRETFYAMDFEVLVSALLNHSRTQNSTLSSHQADRGRTASL